MSVSACEVSWLMFAAPGESLFHQTEGETTTPGRARVVTTARQLARAALVEGAHRRRRRDAARCGVLRVNLDERPQLLPQLLGQVGEARIEKACAAGLIERERVTARPARGALCARIRAAE